MQHFVQTHVAIVALCAIALVALLIIWGVITVSRAKRKAALHRWASRNGFEYTEGPMPAHDLASLWFLNTDESAIEASATNIIRGSRGTGMTLFDLRRTICRGSGVDGNRLEYTTSKHTCALFNLAGSVPDFTFVAMTTDGPDTPNGQILAQLARLTQVAGMGPPGQLIEISGRPGFVLRCRSGDVAPLFTSDRIRFFEDKCGWTVEAAGSWMMLTANPAIYGHGWKRTSLIDVSNFDDFLNVATEIWQHFAKVD